MPAPGSTCLNSTCPLSLRTPCSTSSTFSLSIGLRTISVRSFGPLTADNHPEIDDATLAAELDAAAAAASQELASPLVDEIRIDAFARIDRDLDLDERYGSWQGDAGVVPPDGVTETGPGLLDPSAGG